MNHSFDIENARNYGVIEAIILENILHWLSVNKANETNIQDGKVWTYNSVSAYARLFPYLSTKQIRRGLESLADQKAIVKGEYNKARYDKTSWYSVPDESILAIGPKGQMDVPKRANRSARKGEPIPDINQDVNKHNVSRETSDVQKQVNQLLKVIFSSVGMDLFKDFRLRKIISKAIEQDSIEYVQASLENYLKDEFIKTKSAWNFSSFFASKERLEKYKPKRAAKMADTYKSSMSPEDEKEFVKLMSRGV